MKSPPLAHLQYVQSHVPAVAEGTVATTESWNTAPLFSWKVKNALALANDGKDVFPQYGLMGLRLQTFGKGAQDDPTTTTDSRENNLVYNNSSAPFSTFICGSQGSGKSHTLSCLLENSLRSHSVNNLTKPLSAIVFHYDNFTSFASTQLCEAAWLASDEIPVRILVSPSNLNTMQKLYNAVFCNWRNPPKVLPLYFQQSQLNVAMMKTLMAVSDDVATPLYMEVVMKILRDMAAESGDRPGLDYNAFRARLQSESLVSGQSAPLQMRLQLLESFIDLGKQSKRKNTVDMSHGSWDFAPGTLTIVDLSCPFVSENDACALFNICLSIFFGSRHDGGRLVALDEAHKFLTTKSPEAGEFTETLLSIIRQQRHLATRVIIATQEPTLSPSLLDLSNVTIVHRFSSPAWYKVLEDHLAGALIEKREKNRDNNDNRLFEQIVALRTGEALVFCPTAALDVDGEASDHSPVNDRSLEKDEEVDGKTFRIEELGPRYIKLGIRSRISSDGGKSIMAE